MPHNDTIILELKALSEFVPQTNRAALYIAVLVFITVFGIYIV